MKDEIAIKVHNLHKSFDIAENKKTSLKQFFVSAGKKSQKHRQKVLDGIDFEIKKGEFYGIVGRNGSGKSTLLKLLAGVYTPDEGAVEVNGNLTPFIELGVGFNPELSGRDNVYLSASLLGYTRKQVDAMYDDIVDFAELEEHMDKKLKNYSSGMQVRLAFSIAVKAKNDILIFDEVLAVGDAAFQEKCKSYFRSVKDSGLTVVLVTHDMSTVRDFCTNALLIEDGAILDEGSPEDVSNHYSSLLYGSKPSNHNFIKKVTAHYKDQSIHIEVRYDCTGLSSDLYAGISIVYGGHTFSEANSSGQLGIGGVGKFTADLIVPELNPGIYEVSVAIFTNSGSMICFTGKGADFKVPGKINTTKGSAITISPVWKLVA